MRLLTGELLNLGTDAVNTVTDVSSVTITGDFSFVSRAWLDSHDGLHRHHRRTRQNRPSDG